MSSNYNQVTCSQISFGDEDWVNTLRHSLAAFSGRNENEDC